MEDKGKATVYMTRVHRVSTSRDVVFNESVRGIETKQEESRLVQVEGYNEDDDLVTRSTTED